MGVSILDALVLTAPLFKQIHGQDIMIGVTDREQMLYYEPSTKLDLGLKKGTPISRGDMTVSQALAGKPTTNRHAADLYGYPLITSGVPVYEQDGTIAGTLTIAYTLENEEQLEELMQEVQAISNNLLERVQSVAAQTEELSATSEQMLSNSRQAVEQSQQVNEIAASSGKYRIRLICSA